MNRMKSLCIAAGIALSLVIVLPLAEAADQQQSIPGAAVEKQAGKREQHPEMKHALHALENAKIALEKASHDFGGHRSKALELTEQAIREVREGLKFDQR